MCCRGQQRLLFYTIDADQTFGVDVQTAEGPRSVQALNYFYWIDRLFDTGSVEVMTGKVVGDPPVSPAVMTGNFLEDVLCFLRGMTGLDPGAAYRQPSDDTLRADDAAYHDMAQLFGFTGQSAAYHYRCRKKGEPSNVDCFIEFARQLNSFLHGEHPTRATWFRYQSAPTSLHPARTVYTGNYVFNAAALRWFIPFAPLRLRMSGPTLGRMLKAELGAGFAAVNLPMQHGRTLALTRYIVDQGLAATRTLLGVYSTAELLQDWQRQVIQQAFGCKVFNQYGCREVPNIAWECRAGNMHVFSDMVYLESVRSDGEDRLLVTSLTNRLMPFIRYDIGDTGRLLEGECDCGLPFPLMRMDMCRQNDLIRTRNGKRIHPAYFNRLLYGVTDVTEYQWVQTHLDRLQLKLVSTAPLDAGIVPSIRDKLRRELDERMTLSIDYCDAIPRGASGKHRYVIGLPNGRAAG